MTISHKHLKQKDHDAAEDGDGEKAEAEPGSYEAEDEGYEACERRRRGFDDGWEGHHGKGNVGDVVKEAAEKAVLDLATDEGNRKDADQVGDEHHDGYIDEGALIHCFQYFVILHLRPSQV